VIWQLDLFLLTFAIITAIAAISLKDLLSCVIMMGVFSFFMSMLWTEMGAPDVAFTEAAVGAGVSTAFFVAAIYNIRRGSKD
jgi:uncharacterized MnhB-related membrane protein